MSLAGTTPRISDDWSESASLDDGTRVTLRLLKPDDKQGLLDGFARLSDASRFRRFLGSKSSLSPEELRYLTECDGVDHLAVCATVAHPGGADEGVGVARFIRVPGRPELAEAAITVVDHMQHRGLGRLLGERLVAAARERGVQSFRVMVLAGNDQARALIEEAAPVALLQPTATTSDDALTFEIALPEPAPLAAEPIWREAWRLLLGIAARAYALTVGAPPER